MPSLLGEDLNKLVLFIYRFGKRWIYPSPKRDITIKKIIEQNRWEEISKYVQAKCTSRLAETMQLTRQKLTVKTQVAKLAANSLKQLYGETAREISRITATTKEINSQIEVLTENRRELQLKLKEIETKSTNEKQQHRAYERKLIAKKKENQLVLRNLKEFERLLSEYEPQLKNWQQTLQNKVDSWTCEDVALFLAEIELG